MSSVADEIAEQQAANRSGILLYDSFATHRARMTALVRKASPGGRLCVLGAGNCNDLDLATLGASYREIHLVDLDPESLDRARLRQSPALRARLFLHAPVDLSGLVGRLERWTRFEVTPEELIEHADATSEVIAETVPGPFDVVLSACILTQMQLLPVNVMTDRHPLFEAVRHTLNLTHLRTLLRLQAPGGRAFLVTDVTSDRITSFGSISEAADLRPLMDELVQQGEIFYAANPKLLEAIAHDDPKLRKNARLSGPLDAWAWQNGSGGVFLVYALELTRRD
jgi:hypothetical protein